MLKEINYQNNLRTILIGILVATITIGPLMSGKYVFLLDAVFGPHPELFQDYRFSKLILDFILLPVSKIAPWLYPKGLMFISVLTAFYFSWLLLSRYVSIFPAYIFAFFFAVNPFIYNRMIAGQVFIPFSYSFLPVVALLLMRERSWRKDILTGVLIAIGSLQLHFLPIFLGMVLLFRLRDYYKNAERKHLYSVGVVLLTVFILNFGLLYQLLFQSERGLSSKLSSITLNHVYAFQPHMAPSINYLTSVATLHGFWRQEAYLQVWDFIPNVWFLLFIPIVFFAVYGYLVRAPYRNLFAFMGIFGLIFGTGVATPLFDSLYVFFFQKLPFFSGYRDSHKFVALLVLAFVYLGAFGFQDICSELKEKYKRAYSITFGLIILLLFAGYGYPMFFGFQGQVGTTDFPQDWYEAKELIDSRDEDFKVLFLPWHLYMDFDWVPNKDKRIATPADVFFEKPVISSKNPDMPGISPPQDKVSTTVREFLMTREIKKLNSLDVKYVILAKETDYMNYLWLLDVDGLNLKMNTTNIYLLENQVYNTGDENQ